MSITYRLAILSQLFLQAHETVFDIPARYNDDRQLAEAGSATSLSTRLALI